ncbi:hypothetical protein HID58_047212 [Brassica napus]|uniref:Secreted protein n=3 Tax=Brassica TaxID=3705 RepID=A0ABQ8AYT4_BRANA|nr:hypothetical protein HID58_047212 [Brassica napus]
MWGQGSKRFHGCDLAVFLVRVICSVAKLHFYGVWVSFFLRMFGIQGVWTEQRFPLSSYEVSGFSSYRLAGKTAAISVFGCEVEITGWRARDRSGNSLSLAFTLF